MNKILQRKIKELNRRIQWQRIMAALSAVAIFCTTYIMVLPAITWERSLVCELPEHRHAESCYETVLVPAEEQLICGQEAHTHGVECYEKTLICTEAEHAGHAHVAECYEKTLVCTEAEHAGHTHGEGCFNEAGELICGLAETQGHAHGKDCYRYDLICTEEEAEGHTHTDDCYRFDLVCTAEEHTHSDECYETVGEPHEETVLACGLEEHEHTAACFDAPPAEDDGYYCGQIEHTHSEEQYCYFSDGSPRCTIPEHVHTLACKSDPDADVETAAVWKKTFANVSLSGNWAEDVIAIAKTQLGYKESTRNYIVEEDGKTIKGYTRYGAWYGNSYGHWCAMFCSFCLHYAGVDRSIMPFSGGCEAWVNALKNKGLYHTADSGYMPKSGDLVFFNLDKLADSDHVALVYEVGTGSFTSIEGNWGGKVCSVKRDYTDKDIIGYGELPENPLMTDVTLQTEVVRTIKSEPASDGAVAVVTGMIPDGAIIEIAPVEMMAEQIVEYFGEEKAAEMSGYVAYDITIRVDGEEWQPDETVSVTVEHPALEIGKGEKVGIAHVVSEEENEVDDLENVEVVDGNIGFETDSFSIYILYTFTVDFHFGDMMFSIAGRSEILLSDLFKELGIEKNAAEAVKVEFSNNTLLQAEPVFSEDGNTIVDWKLISLEAFDTNETLTIEFADGEMLIINVTDAQENPVWAYHSTDLTTPYAKYTTVRLAVTNSALRDGDVFEFHGNVTETASATLNIPKNVTIRSENGFTYNWTFPNIATNIYGIYINTVNKTITIGGGSGDGELVINNSGAGGFANVRTGSLVIEDRVTIQNCSGTNGGAIQVNKGTATVMPKLYINGGQFINNKAENGGAIANVSGTTYLNGGSFEGNEAITTGGSGKGNAIYQNSELHISGTAVFSDDQDIFITCTNDANHQNNDVHAMFKDSNIGCASIPVTIGTSISALYEGRNILISGNADVTAEDVVLFSVQNEEELNTYYKKLGYTAKDGGTGNPVIELVPEFVDNMGNFIDDGYKVPTKPVAARTKTARWLDDEKSQAEIVVNEDSRKVEGPILVIGPLCGAHALNGNTIAATINSLAQYNDVEYYFQSATAASKNMFDQGFAGVIRGPVSGTVTRGGTVRGDIFGNNANLYSGAHNSGGYMALKLQKVLQQKQYSNIVLFFDNFCITSYAYYAFTPAEQIAFYQAANLLKPYYDNNQVLWISSAKHVVGIDYETQVSVTEETMTDLLGRGCYSDNENHYHYDETHAVNDAASIGRFDKFNNFFNMALFDPATWLRGVHGNRIPAWGEYDVDNPGVLYSNATQITDYINAWVKRDEIKITDTVDPDLPINHVIIEVSYDNGETWTDITTQTGVSVAVNDQVVECSIVDASYFYTDLRMRIICDCPGEFKTDDNEPKDTNIGNATIDYYLRGELKQSHPLEPPKLYKVFPELKIIKTFTGLTTEQIEALADDFCITVSEKATEEIVAELSIQEHPEAGRLAPDSVSQDGTEYTWKIPLRDGVYIIAENGAELAGYDLTVTGTGTIIVSKENGEVPISGQYEIADGYGIVLRDDIVSSGSVIATVKKDGADAALPEGAHLEWFKSLDGTSWEHIIRTEYVTGSGAHIFNIPEDTLSVNVSLTNGARTSAGVVRYKAVIYADTGEASTVESDIFRQENYWGEIRNGSFESPVVTGGIGPVCGAYNGDYFYAQISGGSHGVSWRSAVLGAEVGLPGQDIELIRAETENQRYGAWASYHNDPNASPDDYKAFTAVKGDQFAEINCETDGALYQDILTEPGTTMYWRLAHRARREATTPDGAIDTMYVVCMSVAQAESLSNGTAMRAAVAEILNGDPNEQYPGAQVWTVSDSADQWVYHNDSFIVPDGQYLTRFFFVASTTNAVGRINAGNLVDDISLSMSLPPIENQYARIIIQKEIIGVKADELEGLRNGLMFEYSYDMISDSVYGSDMVWAATGAGQYILTVPVQNGSAVFRLSEDGTSADLDDYSRFTSVTSADGGTYSNGTYSVSVNGGDTITIKVRNFYIPNVVIVNEYELQKIIVSITKQFEGLTTEQIAALADEFCITISEEATGDTVAVLSLLDDPEDGKLAPDSVSEDGMKYTWKVELPVGVYLLSESGADLPGYARITDGLGTLTVEASAAGGADVPLDPQNNAMQGASEGRGALWDYSADTLSGSGIRVVRVDNLRDAVVSPLDASAGGWQRASSGNAPSGWVTYCTNTGTDKGKIELASGEELYLFISCAYAGFANSGRTELSSLPCVTPCQESGGMVNIFNRNIVVAWLEDGNGNKVIRNTVCVGNEGTSTLFLWQFGGGSPKRIYTNDRLDYNAFSQDMSAYGWDNHATRVTNTDQRKFQGIKPDSAGYYTLWMSPFYNNGGGVNVQFGIDEIAVFEINDASVTVAKEVVGNEEETGSFEFTIQYTDPTNTGVEETFHLKDGESATFYVKPGTDATVAETDTEAYTEAFKVTGDALDYTEGCTAVIHNVTGNRKVTYKNVFGSGIDVDIHNEYKSGRLLPNTGGIGVYPIYALGALLVSGSAMYGYRLRRKRERRAE